MKPLPKTLYISHREDDNDGYYMAELTPEEAIEDDGPTLIGVYQLIGTKRLVKRAVVEAATRRSK